MPTRKPRKTMARVQLQPVLPLGVARKIAQLSQKELADLAGVDHSLISRLESGARDIRDAGLETASRIAWALHVTVADLWPLVGFADGKRIEPLDDVREAVGGRS